MIAAILAVVGYQGLWADFLDGFKVDGPPGFCSWKGFDTEFQGTYLAHKDSAVIVAEVKRDLDPMLWEVSPSFGWHNADGTPADPCTIWSGRKGTIVEGWTVQVDWHLGPAGKGYGHAPGWTHISIHAPCRKDDVPRVRELYDFYFGRAQ